MAWQSGDGVLANVALDRAQADDPSYSMAMLLRQVITAGTPPSMARLPMTPEEVAASYDDAEDLWGEGCDREDDYGENGYSENGYGEDDTGRRYEDGTCRFREGQIDHDLDTDVRHLGIDGES